MVDAFIHLPGDLAALLPALLPREELIDHDSTRPYGLLIALYGMGLFFGPAVLWAGIKARREESLGIARLATSGPLTLAGLYALFSGDLGYIALTLGPFFLWTAWHAWLSAENRLPWLAHAELGLAFAPYLFFAPSGSPARQALWWAIGASVLLVLLVAIVGRPRWLLPPAFRGPDPPPRQRIAGHVVRHTVWILVVVFYVLCGMWLLGYDVPPFERPGTVVSVLGLCALGLPLLVYAFAVGLLPAPGGGRNGRQPETDGSRAARRAARAVARKSPSRRRARSEPSTEPSASDWGASD